MPDARREESTPLGQQAVSDDEVWQAAIAMVSRFGDAAMMEASFRAYEYFEAGDWEDACTWRRVLDAIWRLQAKPPAEGEAVH